MNPLQFILYSAASALLRAVGERLVAVATDRKTAAAMNDAKLRDIFRESCLEFRGTPLADDEKRRRARALIAAKLRAAGVELRDSVINTMLEHAVLEIKNRSSGV